MYLMYYLDESGNRVYTLKKTDPSGKPTVSAHPVNASQFLLQDAKSKTEKNRNGDVEAEPKTNSVGAVPPATALNKTKLTTVPVAGPILKKDKRHSSSRFNITKNRELEMLPSLRGNLGFLRPVRYL
ncbi:hypothetical protein NQ318_013266 [Aromia moschata]|uniref:Nucleolar protein 10 n=1 Tax=Aromia moschata TaxID=1265417 RepID=A0AAV8XTW9_9CUCU|nr:hypothetical protein NQ318_013266 [Aromia moschata]